MLINIFKHSLKKKTKQQKKRKQKRACYVFFPLPEWLGA